MKAKIYAKQPYSFKNSKGAMIEGCTYTIVGDGFGIGILNDVRDFAVGDDVEIIFTNDYRHHIIAKIK